MCGICGFNWADGVLVEQMKTLLVHRGPDDHGSYVADGVSLGHRRLSIVDLSDHGRQPLTNEDYSVWVTFNGEIYNHAELRARLQAKGHVFRSRTDTESIVHAYEEYGLEFVKHLTGMFALGLWDARKHRLVLARDRLGIKPLYYHLEECPGEGPAASTGPRVRFASEIKALLVDPRVPRKLNAQGLFDFMGYEFTPAPETLFEGIRKLLPGCLLIVEPQGARVSRYWNLERQEVEATGSRSLGRARKTYGPRLLEILERSCADHTMSDVPLGAFLSGGIDSSTVVSFLSPSSSTSQPSPTALQTFALGYRERSFSEFEYARQVAEHFRTRHRELLIPPVDAAAIERSVWHLDEPTTDPSNLPFMLICEEARRYVKVCLSGDGGDEILMGYDRFRASKAAAVLERLPLPFRQQLYRAIVRRTPDDERKKGVRNVLKRFLQGALLPADGEHIRWQYFLDPAEAGDLFAGEWLHSVDRDPFVPVKRWSQLAAPERGAREQFVELNTVLPDSVLMKVDKMSMACGLEVRPPFLDHRVVEFCYSLPTSLKLRGLTTKWLLKAVMRERLPAGIATRGKQGFSIPMKNWIRGELQQLTRDEVFSSRLIAERFRKETLERYWREHQQRLHNHSHLFWALLNLSLWERRLLSGPRPMPANAGSTPSRAPSPAPIQTAAA